MARFTSVASSVFAAISVVLLILAVAVGGQIGLADEPLNNQGCTDTWGDCAAQQDSGPCNPQQCDGAHPTCSCEDENLLGPFPCACVPAN